MNISLKISSLGTFSVDRQNLSIVELSLMTIWLEKLVGLAHTPLGLECKGRLDVQGCAPVRGVYGKVAIALWE